MADRNTITLPSLAALENIPTGCKYLTLPEGILELIEVVGNVIGLICVSVAPNQDDDSTYWHFQTAAAVFAFVTGVIMVLYMTGIVHKIKVPWSLMEVVYCCIGCLFMLVVASHLIANVQGSAAAYVGSVLGFVVAIAYLIEVGFAVRAWKRSIIAETLRMVEAYNKVNTDTTTNMI